MQDSVVRKSFRSAYSPPVKVTLDCSVDGPGRTRQGHKDECDLNVIMKRYERTGALDPRLVREGRFGDVSAVDYQEAMFTVASARSAFASLPARVRDRFGNDPGQLVAFCDNPANYDEAVSLGLIEPPAPPSSLQADGGGRPKGGAQPHGGATPRPGGPEGGAQPAPAAPAPAGGTAPGAKP